MDIIESDEGILTLLEAGVVRHGDRSLAASFLDISASEELAIVPGSFAGIVSSMY